MQTDELIQMLSEDAAPVKRLAPAPLRAGKWLLAMLGVLVAGTAVLGLRPDVLQRLADPMFLLESAMMSIAGLAAAVAAFRLGRPDVEIGAFNKVLVAISGVIWALLNIKSFYLSGDEAIAHSATSMHEAHCLIELVVFGVPSGAVLLAMIRRAAPVHLPMAGFAAALAVLSFAALGARYTCDVMEPAHLLVWHFLPVLILGAAGFSAGRKLLNW